MTTHAAQENHTPTDRRGLAVHRKRQRPGTIVRATDADGLAVGILARYGTLADPYPGVPYIRPLDGGDEFQAVADCLRPATADEVERARAER